MCIRHSLNTIHPAEDIHTKNSPTGAHKEKWIYLNRRLHPYVQYAKITQTETQLVIRGL